MNSRFIRYFEKTINQYPYRMSIEQCDVLQQIIIKKLAKIPAEYRTCYLGAVDGNQDRLFFKITGFDTENSNVLWNYFLEYDPTATLKKLNEANTYYFELNVSSMEKLAPQILKEINDLPRAELQVYQEQSAQHKTVMLYRLIDEIIMQLPLFLANFPNATIKQQLNTVFKEFLMNLENYEKQFAESDQNYLEPLIEPIKKSIARYDAAYEQSTILKNMEMAGVLKEKLDLLTQKISTFHSSMWASKQQKPGNTNQNHSINMEQDLISIRKTSW